MPEAGLGLLGPGHRAPNDALLLGEGAPTGGDGAENPADRDLGGGAGVERDEGRVGVLAVAIALPDPVPPLA